MCPAPKKTTPPKKHQTAKQNQCQTHEVLRWELPLPPGVSPRSLCTHTVRTRRARQGAEHTAAEKLKLCQVGCNDGPLHRSLPKKNKRRRGVVGWVTVHQPPKKILQLTGFGWRRPRDPMFPGTHFHVCARGFLATPCTHCTTTQCVRACVACRGTCRGAMPGGTAGPKGQVGK